MKEKLKLVKEILALIVVFLLPLVPVVLIEKITNFLLSVKWSGWSTALLYVSCFGCGLTMAMFNAFKEDEKNNK